MMSSTLSGNSTTPRCAKCHEDRLIEVEHRASGLIRVTCHVCSHVTILTPPDHASLEEPGYGHGV